MTYAWRWLAITEVKSARQGTSVEPVPLPLELAQGLIAADAGAAKELGVVLTSTLDASSSGFSLFTGLAELAEQEARAFLPSASALMGTLLPQDANGALLRDVRYRGVRLGEGATGRYSDSREGGSLHTDGPHLPGEPPDYFTLFCVRQAAAGGGLILVHLDDILARLSPESVRTLRGVFQFDRRVAHAADPTVARPVLTDERISYLREYINLGHAHPGVPPLLPSQRSALDELDALLDGSAPRRSWKLAPGELAVIDNRTLCHGRTPFRDDADGTQRLMLRNWIRATGGRRR